MNDGQARPLIELSKEVSDAAQKTSFALMKANTRERKGLDALDGIQAVAPEERDLAVRVRDSIWLRFDSLRFHYNLLVQIHGGHVEALARTESGPYDHQVLLNAAFQEQFLFDDFVFNSSSLFDYVACAIWFGFHGRNPHKKDWSDTTSAAREEGREPSTKSGRSIHGSRTGKKVLQADRDFVGDLYGYRSDLIHDRIDIGTVSSGYRFTGGDLAAELTVSVPEDYARDVKALLPPLDDEGEDPELTVAADHLIRRVGAVVLDLLEALREDLDWDEDEPFMMLG